jgi:hypothetical protein
MTCHTSSYGISKPFPTFAGTLPQNHDGKSDDDIQAAIGGFDAR